MDNLSLREAFTSYTQKIKEYISGKSGGGSSLTIDSELSDTSENAVQNKVIKDALDKKANTNIATTSANGLMSSDMIVKLNDLITISMNMPSQIVFGFYTGDGEDSQNVDLGFRPYAVLMAAQTSTSCYQGYLFNSSGASSGYLVLDGYPVIANTTLKAEITDTGFCVYGDRNKSNIKVNYIAFAPYSS